MGELLKVLPHLVIASVVGVSAFLGIYLLTISKDTLHEKYCNLVYSLTQNHPDDEGTLDDRYLVWTTRTMGGLSLAVCLGVCIFAYFKYTR